MIRIVYDDNGTSHGDITLQVGESLTESDSYYWLQSAESAAESPAQFVRQRLAKLIGAWSKGVTQFEDCYLLAELHDQFSRWICCRRVADQCWVQLGWSTESGHDLSPADPPVRQSPPQDWQAEEGSVSTQMPLEELLKFGGSLQMLNAQFAPLHDPTPIFEHFRGAYGTQLLTAAVAHFDLFGKLNKETLSRPRGQLQRELELESRPFIVLTTALKAMGLLIEEGDLISATPLAVEHLQHHGCFSVTNYIGLAATSPDVLGMVERLKKNTPYGLEADDDGVAFIYRDGMRSAMEQNELARHFTLSLAGRARNVAPVLADRYRLNGAKTLLDIGGGSGIYAITYLARNHQLEAIVMDRPEVLHVAAEFAEEFGVTDRLQLLEGDMFADPFPAADVMLLSNVLHDWDVPECAELVAKCAQALPSDGWLLIHDVFLDDDLAGPLPIALYSAALFSLTEGRAYSVGEYANWMQSAGLEVSGPTETLVHCGVLCGRKS